MIGGEVIKDQELKDGLKYEDLSQQMGLPLKLEHIEKKEQEVKIENLDQQMGWSFEGNNVEEYLINYWMVYLCFCSSLFSFEY